MADRAVAVNRAKMLPDRVDWYFENYKR